ncbi:MAG: nucleotidyltransferase family protein [Actinobacteria bacterium]|nr:nucleotidyltransferase family protein [Actinomycetota bacterium]NIS28698.1 nucleotidyltransferase family protein [Actinomycetota bacterium]NIT94099.1 nucleotidyltransferase family protein [Actinomycetota bacterium]NIU17726.1 nucleotidyltransferase family protein [Actinomycetota bacterium]NIU64164.1 nucleotidyltransferase family protein [Actinomycetota bacterium]
MTDRHDHRGEATTAAVILAAGSGSRFTGDAHKLLTEVRGKPIVGHAVDAARDAGFDEVVVVTGCVDLVAVLPDDVTILHNERWEDGQATSLRAAVAYAEDRGHRAIVVGLGDNPGVTAADWRAVGDSESDLAAADFGEGHRPPVRLAASMWASLPVSGDEGARSLLRQRPEMVESVACEGDPADVDTLEDLRRWT